MVFELVEKVMCIGGSGKTKAGFQFYKRGFVLGGSGQTPSWQDIILSGNTALTLVNAKANSLNYLKFFGDTELLPETYLDTVTLSGGCEQRNLPSGYTQVAYIDNNGTAWLDLGMPIGSSDIITFDLAWNAFNQNPFFGAYNVGGAYNCDSFVGTYAVVYSSKVFYISNNSLNLVTATANTRYLIKWNGVNNYPTVDGVESETGTLPYDSFTPNVNAYLFARNQGGVVGGIDDITFYGFKVERNGATVMNLIPARRNSDSVLGMYDTVSGNFLTNAGTGDFTAGADVVPTPTTPVDIVCNNGGIKVRNKSGLPLGYQKIEYLQSDGACYINTGVVVDTVAMTYKFRLNDLGTGTSTSLFGTESQPTGPYSGIFYSNSNVLYLGTASRGAMPIGANKDHILEIKNNTYTIFEDGVSIKNGNYSGSPITNISLYIFANHDEQSGAVQKRNCGFKYFQIYKNDVLVSDLIPCRRKSDNVLGMYDLVSNTFLTNQDTGTFTAGADIDDMEIYTDGTQEVVTDSLGNTANAERLLAVGDYKDTQEVLNGSVTRNVGVMVLDGSENWTPHATIVGWFQLSVENVYGNIAPALCTHYPYSSSQAGVGVYFSTGRSNPQTKRIIIADNVNFPNTGMLAEFKQYLADQYANGTPVIVVYPLATATTSTVTGQFLSKSPVTQTAGSIDNLPIAITESSHTTPTPTNPLQINCNNGVVKVRNLFNQSIFASSGSSITYTPYQVPNGVYTMSSPDFPFTNSVSNVFFLAGNVSSGASSANNGVAKDKPVTITVTDGYYTVAHRTTSTNMNYPKDYNWQIEQGSTATPYIPYGATYTDGTTETVEITGKNLLNSANFITGFGIKSDGTELRSKNSACTPYIKVKPNTKYTLSGVASLASVYSYRGCEYNSSYTKTQNLGDYNTQYTTLTFTTSATTEYIRITLKCEEDQDISQAMLELGSTATTYEPYYNGGTATAEMLLKVGNYQDVQSVIDGGVTRNIGIKVLDGTERWEYFSVAQGNLFRIIISDSVSSSKEALGVICNKYKVVNSNYRTDLTLSGSSQYYDFINDNYTTLEDWKAAIVEQYNSGSPLIVVYPIQTPTTETVTAQPLTIQEGTNIVEITQASIDNLELEVKYKAQASGG